jgi:replicative DNA helicase
MELGNSTRSGAGRGEQGAPAGGFQQLPNSEESERAVLAAILLSPTILPSVSARLVVEDFFLDRHQFLYQAMLDLQELGKPIDLRTMQARLELKNAFEAVGGLAYLTSLDLFLPDIHRTLDYVEVVKERSTRRRLMRISADLTASCLGGGQEASDILAEAERELLSLGQNILYRGFVPFEDVVRETLAAIEERAAGGMVGLSTGFYDWDRMTQGLVAGNLVIIAGRPGMGKTSFAVNVAQHITIRSGKTVGVFSLEMGQQELAQRVLASEADLPFTNLRSGQLSDGQWGSLFETIKRISRAPLFIDDSASPTLLEVASKCRRLKMEADLGLVIIDYLQLMQAGGKFENRQIEIATISRGLKQLAKELGIPVIALSQLSRQTERRSGDHRPQLADLRESGAIEQDADMVCFIYRDEIYNKDDPEVKGLAELIIAKHRNGPTGTVNLAFFGENTSFRNLARDSGDFSF